MQRAWPIVVFLALSGGPLSAQRFPSVPERADSTEKAGNHAAATKAAFRAPAKRATKSR